MLHDFPSDIPIRHTTDVLVVGGGPAGVGAALAAARNGAQVLVVEQFNCLGGVSTAGGHGHICRFDEIGTGRQVVAGIADEIARQLVDRGFGRRNAYGAYFECEGMKLVLEDLTQAAGVRLLYHTFFCDSVVQDGRIVGVVVQNKGGRQGIRAQRVIDCSGDGDAAFQAGCHYEIGRAGDGACQPVTLMFQIGGVDFDRVREFEANYKATYAGDPRPGNLDRIWAEAIRNGDMPPFQTARMGWWWTPTRPDQLGINFTHVTKIDTTSAEDLTRATIEARRQVFQTIPVYRKYVPGMEKCHLLSTPATLGLRESRRIMGDYVLNEQDVRACRTFDDAIAWSSFFVDIHNLDGPGMSPTAWHPPEGFKYQVPYRILVPRQVDNLLVAGRNVSCTHIALGSLRVMVPCIAMGEAAGTAAALSLARAGTPRELPVETLRAQLRSQGAIVDEAGIRPAP